VTQLTQKSLYILWKCRSNFFER